MPLRMCIVCKKLKEKGEMLRIVKTPQGDYTINPKENGRGAYVCNSDECVKKCIEKKLLNRAFKTKIDDAVYEKILNDYAKRK